MQRYLNRFSSHKSVGGISSGHSIDDLSARDSVRQN